MNCLVFQQMIFHIAIAANDADGSFSMNHIFNSCLIDDDNGNTSSGDTAKEETENVPFDAGKADNAYPEVKDGHTTKRSQSHKA